MANKAKEESLINALAYCDLRKMPKAWDGENIYLKALALVVKADGTESYVLLAKGKNGEDRVLKDFGSISAIRVVKEVYPFLFLDSKWIPTFNTKTKDERIAWLLKYDVDCEKEEVLKELSVKELNKKVLFVVMKNSLNSIKAK